MLTTSEIDELQKSVLSFIEFYEKCIILEYENNYEIQVLSDKDKNLYNMCMYMDESPYEILPNKFEPSSDIPLVNKLSNYPYKYCIHWNQQVELFYYKWFDKPKPIEVKSFYFYTFTGDKKIPFCEKNVNDMKYIGNSIFSNESWKRYKCVDWCIESGKHSDEPNLHLHALIVFDKTNKNFERDFVRLWNNKFKNYGINFKGKGKQHFKGKDVVNIYKDKCDYFINHKKSVLHENFVDIDILEHIE